MKLQAFDSSHLCGKNHFEVDVVQNYFVFQPVSIYFTIVPNTNEVTAWKSKGLSDESIKLPLMCENSLNPGINYIDNAKIWVKFDRSCLKQEKVTLAHKQMVNIYIVFVINLWPLNVGKDFLLANSLFGAINLTTNPDPDKYKHSGYGTGFDARGSFSLNSGGFGKSLVIFGADMGSSAHIDNKKKAILILGKGPADGLDNTALTAEKEYLINFTEQQKKFCLSLLYNGVISYIFVNDVEIYQFKAKDSEINVFR